MANTQQSDTHFMNSFGLVLGMLMLIAIILFVFARHIGGKLQAEFNADDGLLQQSTQNNLAPVAMVAVAGQDNSALAKLDQAAPAPAADVPATGEAAYQKICSACHATGVAGAPKAGDDSVWGPRIAEGKATLYKHAVEGFTGSKGVMPARGGTTWPDATIHAAVDYMVSLDKKK